MITIIYHDTTFAVSQMGYAAWELPVVCFTMYLSGCSSLQHEVVAVCVGCDRDSIIFY